METSNVHNIQPNYYPAFDYLNEGLFKSKGFGMVYAPNNVSGHRVYIRNSNYLPSSKFNVSICICTVGRKESLIETIQSLSTQEYGSFEVVLITEKGNLAECRQKGLEVSSGSISIFIDDDVTCPKGWLGSIVKRFESDNNIVGVTGPTIITDEFKVNRDLFKWKPITWLYNKAFIGKASKRPAALSKSGAVSLLSNYENSYEGKADYLEACNFSVRTKEALECGGFSKDYIKTSEWCEVDLALRLAQRGILYYANEAKLYHRPSKAGVYKERLNTKHRWENFKLFQKRWIKPCLRSRLYQAFMWSYFKWKEAVC